NFRIYDKSESKTKNDYFMDMLSEVLSWGAKIQFITGDSWYSSTENLKTIRKYGIRFMFGVDSNRKVSPEKGQWFQLRLLPDFHQGQIKMVKIFQLNFRIYDKSESKTKNDYFMDMLSEVLSWGAKIQF
ncbi:hypothetical protein BUE68_12515, partial [Corynebacterium diphtheriae]